MGTRTVSNKILAGLLAALGSAIFFGLNATATKVLYAPDTPSHIDPLGLITVRSLWTLPLFVLLALLTRPRNNLTPSRNDLGWFLLSGICYGPATTAMFALGVGHTSAAHAVLLLALAPVFASILAVIFLHERLHAIRVAAILAGATGACVLTFSRAASGSTPLGDAMVLVMVFSWGVMALALRVLNRRYPALFVAGIMGAIGSLILVGLGAVNHRLDDGWLPLRYYDLKTILAFDLELVVLAFNRRPSAAEPIDPHPRRHSGRRDYGLRLDLLRPTRVVHDSARTNEHLGLSCGRVAARCACTRACPRPFRAYQCRSDG